MMKKIYPILFMLLLTACAPPATPASAPTSPPLSTRAADIEGLAASLDEYWPTNRELAYTNQNASGNRYVPGQIDMPNARVVDIALDGQPTWVLGMALAEGRSLWLAVLADGRVQAFDLDGDNVTAIAGFPKILDEGQLPALLNAAGEWQLLNSLFGGQLANNHPIIYDAQLAAIDREGQLLLEDAILDVDALPDGRLLSNGRGSLLMLTAPSDIYPHGIMGDALEAQALTLVEAASGTASEIVRLDGGDVFETLAPIWLDWDRDGQQDIIVTLSNINDGARIVVYDQAGQRVASSAPIGQGYRWRHPIAVAPFGPNGEMELVDVLTPHIGGVVEFFQWDADQLRIVAQLDGYTSHVINSRNLDMALAADVNADGRAEVLLPDQSLRSLAAIQRTEAGAALLWEIELGARLSSNLASARFADETIAIGAGLESGILRLWLP